MSELGQDARAGSARERHEARLAAVRASLRAGSAAGIGLAKRTSNLFRDRSRVRAPAIDLSGFDEVLDIDAGAGWVDAEGMVPYDALADATLSKGTVPCVVPQLRSITLGGAVAGVGIEASAFRHGLVHETVLELEVLAGDGRVLRCTPDNEHADLYFGFPNSYGTLGYALRVRARTRPTRPFVRLEHERHVAPEAFFEALGRHCDDAGLDFLDGVVFDDAEMVLTLGRFVEAAPATSDYTFEHIYYRSLREKRVDFLTARDYLWRWDTDWFWCSKNLGAQHPLVRRLLGRERLNSRTYGRIMRWNSRVGLTRALARLRGWRVESVIQDVDIPLESAAAFLRFLRREVGILPIWVCPIRPGPDAARFVLYPMRPGVLLVNFGFWDVVRSREARAAGFVNRRIEAEVRRLGGIKSLYSESYFGEDEFAAIYGGEAYAALKRRYDPDGSLPTLYEKCVLRR